MHPAHIEGARVVFDRGSKRLDTGGQAHSLNRTHRGCMEDKKSHEHKTVALSTKDLFAEGDARVSMTTPKVEIETRTAPAVDSDDDGVEDGDDISVKEADDCYDDEEERGNDDEQEKDEEEDEEEEDDEVDNVVKDCSSTSIDNAEGDSWRSDQHSSNSV